MKKVLIINGPNLNLLGKREPEIYGNQSFDEFLNELQSSINNVELEYFQSNTEGVLIDKIHASDANYSFILFNPGGYTHTSIALADAIKSINTPVLEIHISNINGREEFRKTSVISPSCIGMIAGLGLDSYRLGIEHGLENL